MRAVLAAGLWMAAAWMVQVAAGSEIGRSSRQLEERLELRLIGAPVVPLDRERPARTREEPIEPWELVGV